MRPCPREALLFNALHLDSLIWQSIRQDYLHVFTPFQCFLGIGWGPQRQAASAQSPATQREPPDLCQEWWHCMHAASRCRSSNTCLPGAAHFSLGLGVLPHRARCSAAGLCRAVRQWAAASLIPHLLSSMHGKGRDMHHTAFATVYTPAKPGEQGSQMAWQPASQALPTSCAPAATPQPVGCTPPVLLLPPAAADPRPAVLWWAACPARQCRLPAAHTARAPRWQR